MQEGLAGLRRFRDWRAEEIGRRLARHGIERTLEGARALSHGPLISRTHFARYLVQLGLFPDVRKVFKHYLVSGKPGHVPGDWASVEQAVGWIRDAGGVAVVAHPATRRLYTCVAGLAVLPPELIRPDLRRPKDRWIFTVWPSSSRFTRTIPNHG